MQLVWPEASRGALASVSATWRLCGVALLVVLLLRDGKVQGRKVDEHGPRELIKSSDRVTF